MSEKIVQLNEEIIKAQIKELVRSSVEETLNELLGKEAESPDTGYPLRAQRGPSGYRSGHYDRNLTTTSGNVTPTCRGSSACPSRQPSSSGITAGRAAWRRPSSRCIWQAFPCAVWRTSRRHCGTARFRPPPSAS